MKLGAAAGGGEFPQAEFISAEDFLSKGVPRTAKAGWGDEGGQQAVGVRVRRRAAGQNHRIERKVRGCGRVFPDTALFLAFVSVGRAAVSCGYGPVRDREGAAGLEWAAFSVSGLVVQDTKNKGAAGHGICEYPEGR